MTQIQTCDVSAAREQSSLRARFDPVSFSLRALVWLAALTVVVVFMWLVGYIVIKGLPYLSPRLFEWEYSTENVSMLPAIVITVLMVVLALLFAAPVGMGAAIYPTRLAGWTTPSMYGPQGSFLADGSPPLTSVPTCGLTHWFSGLRR